MLNRCVFSLDLKVACEGLDCTSLRKEFHTVGEIKQKDRLKLDATYGISREPLDGFAPNSQERRV